MRFPAISFVATLALPLVTPVFVSAVQSSGEHNASTTSWAPSQTTPWDYVGSISTASGVYLGNYGGDHWVITAAHVSTNNFILGGHSYSRVADSLVRFSPVGDAVYSPDMVMFRINPGNAIEQAYLNSLVVLDLVDRPLAVGTSVRLIGHGDNNPSAVIKSWGDSIIVGEYDQPPASSGTRYENSVYYTNDRFGVGAIQGDSGGGAFYWTGTSWALAGIMNATLAFGNGDSGVSIIRLDAYMDQILAVVPEPGTLAAVSALLALGSVLVARHRRRF